MSDLGGIVWWPVDKICTNVYGGTDYKAQTNDPIDKLAENLQYGDRILTSHDIGIIHQCSVCGRGWLRYSLIAFVPMRGPCCPSKERLMEIEENFRDC